MVHSACPTKGSFRHLPGPGGESLPSSPHPQTPEYRRNQLAGGSISTVNGKSLFVSCHNSLSIDFSLESQTAGNTMVKEHTEAD